MKDATGELSMTAIAVVAIAAIGLVFSQLVWPAIKSTITRNANCSEAYQCKNCSGGLCTCLYLDESTKTKTVKCPQQQ